MHTIADKEFTLDDFSYEHLETEGNCHLKLSIADYDVLLHSYSLLEITVGLLNSCRNLYLQTKDKKYWWQMIQLLPSSYNQKRTIKLNYEVLANMYHARKNHRLDEWREFCKWIETLPYSELITESKKKGGD